MTFVRASMFGLGSKAATHVVVDSPSRSPLLTEAPAVPRRTLRVVFGLLQGAAVVTTDFLAVALDGVTDELLAAAPKRFNPFGASDGDDDDDDDDDDDEEEEKDEDEDDTEDGNTRRDWLPCASRRSVLANQKVLLFEEGGEKSKQLDPPKAVLEPVSYTHLTLPTICSV